MKMFFIAHCLIYTYKICLLNENVFELFQPKLKLSVGGNYVAQNKLSKSELLPDKQNILRKLLKILREMYIKVKLKV